MENTHLDRPGSRGPGRGARYRTAIAAVCSLALTTGGILSFAGSAQAAGPMFVAPYVDMTSSTESLLNTAISQDGLRAYTAAFAIGEGCNDIWGDTLPIGGDPTIGAEISSARAAGAQVIVSNGGADGEPISFTCTNQGTIDAAYQAIINDYGTDHLDFDVEGAAIADTAGINRTIQAMKDLKGSNPSLVWSFTIPVTPTGLDFNGQGVLRDAQNMGVTIPIVNIMAMDYFAGNIEMGNAAISAAQGTLNQMKAVNGSYTFANVGLTPMIGVNDDRSTFTLADASSVTSWANSNGLGRLAFWSVSRDQACPGGNGGAAQATCSGVAESTGQFTHTFTGGGSGGPTSTVISLRAHANNMIVTAENAGASSLIANRTAINAWEEFDLIHNGDGSVSFRAHANNLIVTAENAGASALIANRTAIGAWEEFDLITNGDGSISLRAHANSHFVTAENAGASPLIANRTAIGGWEEFDLIND